MNPAGRCWTLWTPGNNYLLMVKKCNKHIKTVLFVLFGRFGQDWPCDYQRDPTGHILDHFSNVRCFYHVSPVLGLQRHEIDGTQPSQKATKSRGLDCISALQPPICREGDICDLAKLGRAYGTVEGCTSGVA